VVGENGYIVDVSTNDCLREIIKVIDKSPLKFKQYSANYQTRTAIEQVAELVTIYNDVLESNKG
jgi:hypothetical protein